MVYISNPDSLYYGQAGDVAYFDWSDTRDVGVNFPNGTFTTVNLGSGGFKFWRKFTHDVNSDSGMESTTQATPDVQEPKGTKPLNYRDFVAAYPAMSFEYTFDRLLERFEQEGSQGK
jgi:hypothetical protein